MKYTLLNLQLHFETFFYVEYQLNKMKIIYFCGSVNNKILYLVYFLLLKNYL